MPMRNPHTVFACCDKRATRVLPHARACRTVYKLCQLLTLCAGQHEPEQICPIFYAIQMHKLLNIHQMHSCRTQCEFEIDTCFDSRLTWHPVIMDMRHEGPMGTPADDPLSIDSLSSEQCELPTSCKVHVHSKTAASATSLTRMSA